MTDSTHNSSTTNSPTDTPEQIQAQALQAIESVADERALEQLRVDYLGKKGRVTELLKQLGTLPPADRKAHGDRVNRVKDLITQAVDMRSSTLAEQGMNARLADEALDVTLSGRGDGVGGVHPITRTIQRIERLFNDLGFETVEGPEIEDDFHNFGALNIPEAHPARAMQDTFYVNNGSWVLRTHTSPVQIRTMERYVKQGIKPPIRIICPGRVYRCDSDRTHSPMFHQVEGLYVAENVAFSDLKYDLMTFLSRFFERDAEVLFRPSYFPFVEPGADVHMKLEGRWLELLGCGMVHPKVFEAVGLDPERYTGFAFGMGVERLAMLRYGINDLRQFFENDLRFLEAFK